MKTKLESEISPSSWQNIGEELIAKYRSTCALENGTTIVSFRIPQAWFSLFFFLSYFLSFKGVAVKGITTLLQFSRTFPLSTLLSDFLSSLAASVRTYLTIPSYVRTHLARFSSSRAYTPHVASFNYDVTKNFQSEGFGEARGSIDLHFSIIDTPITFSRNFRSFDI